MPIYVYACDCTGCYQSCCTQEYVHGMDEDPWYDCSICGAKMHRVPQHIGVAFKGTGFYHNDKSKP